MEKISLKSSGIIIRITDFKESDQIFDLFTSKGELIGFFARSSRKPKSKLHGIISIGNFVNITFTKGKNLNYPNEINYDLKKVFSFQKKSLDAMYFYSDVLTLIRLVAKDFQEKEVYDLLVDTFEKAERYNNSNLLNIYNDFLKSLLEILGINAEIRSFASGNEVNDKEFYYHPESNSVFEKGQKPNSLDLPLIQYDNVFEKKYLQKLLFSTLNMRISLKF